MLYVAIPVFEGMLKRESTHACVCVCVCVRMCASLPCRHQVHHHMCTARTNRLAPTKSRSRVRPWCACEIRIPASMLACRVCRPPRCRRARDGSPRGISFLMTLLWCQIANQALQSARRRHTLRDQRVECCTQCTGTCPSCYLVTMGLDTHAHEIIWRHRNVLTHAENDKL